MDPSQEPFRERPDKISGLTTRESLELFQEAHDKAVDEAHSTLQQSLTGGENAGETVKPKLTLDLRKRNLIQIPKEVIAIIGQDVERLQLAHNQLSHIAYEFIGCSALRYLNLRDNRFREVPKAIFGLPQLEILDLSKNKIGEVPDEIEQMKALRVFSIQHNNVGDLPFCLGSINTLRMLKLTGNPLTPRLKRIVEGSDLSPGPSPAFVDNEIEKDTMSTKKVLEYLRTLAAAKDSEGDSSDGPLETPRALLRFPVQARKYGHTTSESESASELRSPGFAKPPLPARSHYRIPSSQNNVLLQNAAIRRPGLAPLSLGNERNRSNSESILQATQTTRNKRMGIVPKKQTELTVLDETRANRNSYHLRGQSHGSALRQGVRAGDISPSNMTSLHGSEDPRGLLGRPLSSLPQQKERKLPGTRTIEAAKGILYSLNLVHHHLGMLFPVIKEGKPKRSSLERVFHNAAIHVEHLDQELSKCMRDAAQGSDFTHTSKKAVRQATHACILTHEPIAQLATRSTGQLVQDADPKYIRTLLLLLYGSLNEMYNCNKKSGGKRPANKAPKVNVKQVPQITANAIEAEETSKNRDDSVTPTRDRPKPERRWRNGGSVQQYSNHIDLNAALGIQTAVPLYLNGRSRSNSRAGMFHGSTSSSVVSTPRSGESFSSARLAPRSRSGSVTMMPDQARIEKEQRAQFEQIFVILRRSADEGLQIIPQLQPFFVDAAEASQRKYTHEKIRELWLTLVNRNRTCLNMSEKLKKRLSTIKLNDPEARNARDFWRLVKDFVDSYGSFLASLREARLLNLVPSDMRHQVRPVHKSATEAATLITNSPWNRLTFEVEPQTQPPSRAQTPAPNGYHAHQQHRTRGSGGSNAASSSSPYTPSVPATPLSAALGPAAQATVPATPASASLNRSFEGDVFQRADSLLNLQNTMYHRR
ncbi:MAG: RAM signaling network component [Alectoria sarmentosa]|nr:MAG: RAM signaling network component [Alectoria sarmentosa]